MKTFRLFILLLGVALSFAPAAQAADSLKPNEKQLIGMWEEYSPKSNCVEYLPDHTMRIHLTEDEGALPDGSHFITLKWSMDEKNQVTLTMTLGERTHTEQANLSFKKGEMWMHEGSGNIVKHRRVSKLPARFVW